MLRTVLVGSGLLLFTLKLGIIAWVVMNPAAIGQFFAELIAPTVEMLK